MPGPITHAAVALLARDRIRQIRDALQSKQNSVGAVSEIEKSVRFLAEKALAIMTHASPGIDPPAALYGPAPDDDAGDRVSKFLLLGSVGPDIPEYAAWFAENQQWLRDTIHKGTPDANREQVLTGSCNLALSFWRHVKPRIDAEFPFSGNDTPEKRRHDDALASMQAYVLGHFCHVAADVLSTPFVDSLEWRLGHGGDSPWQKRTREEITGAIEAETARSIFRRGSETRGSGWIDWWPAPEQIPSAFYAATIEALEETYGPGATRLGLMEYEERRAQHPPVRLSEALLRDGYVSFRKVFDRSASWDYWDWLSATWFLFLPAFAAFPLALAMPNGREYFRAAKSAGYDEGKARFELIALPFALGSLVPLSTNLIVAHSFLGAEPEVTAGWISTGVQLASAVGFFATIGTGAGALPWRYALTFALPLALDAFYIVYTRTRGATNARRMQLLAGSILAPVLSLLFLALYWAFLHDGVDRMQGPEKDAGEFVWRLVVWFTILFAAWWLTAWLLRALVTPGADDRISKEPHPIRLFDDGTLFMQTPAALPAPSPTLADLFYPSGRRALLKLWWDGDGTAKIVVHRDRLEFHFGAHKQIAPVPAAGTTILEFAAWLERNVRDAAGKAGLKARPCHTAEGPDPHRPAILALENHELPAGLAFSDEGDAETTEKGRAAKLGVARDLHPSNGEPYVLHHAPKAVQSVRFDSDGPVHPVTPDAKTNGLRFVAGIDDTLDTGGSIMNHAADLSALLCLAATSQMLPPGELGDLRRVHQVFRNWNLDRRRENEWKMLVLGGAVSEKGGNVQSADPALPRIDPPQPVRASGGEPLAASIGWINVLRKWVEMARTPDANATEPAVFRPGNPTNLELSRALAFLLDLPDPGGAP